MTSATRDSMLPPFAPGRAADDDKRDLGFGAVVSRESRMRLLNRDGTFNVERRGISWLKSLSAFHWLLTMSWPRFFAVTVAFYLVSNVLFAAMYLACGTGALAVPPGDVPASPYTRAFFFSVQTIATIGYGHVHPVGTAANVLVTIESLFGLLGFAIVTGILFARFSRPTARILFSKHAVVAPFNDGAALMLRLVNGRRSELTELEVRVILSRFETTGERRRRAYHRLTLQREEVAFFPLGFTVVHLIDDKSPLHGMTAAKCAESEAEFLVLIRAIDEGLSQTVHARTSYRGDEILWGRRFSSLFETDGGSMLSINAARLHDVEPAPFPTAHMTS